MKPIENEDWHRDDEQPTADVERAEREGEAAQGRVTQGVYEPQPRVLQHRADLSGGASWVRQPQHDRRRRNEDAAGHSERPLAAEQTDKNAGQWRREECRDHVAAAVESVGPLPEMPRRQNRKQ